VPTDPDSAVGDILRIGARGLHKLITHNPFDLCSTGWCILGVWCEHRPTGEKAQKTEYVKTLCCTLLFWQPWHTRTPGCAWQEESCEAMLSRMAHRCRQHPQLHEYEDTVDLYLTVPNPRFGARDRAGGLRQELVQLFRARLRRLVERATVLPYLSRPKTSQTHVGSNTGFDVGGPASMLSEFCMFLRVPPVFIVPQHT
jgi:hypothetical protein